jgi:fluoride ion exporter CrcB/FEX
MMNTLKAVIHDCLTGKDGTTYDPARVAGYTGGFATLATFLGNSIYITITTHHFDMQAFGIGGAAILGGIAAVAFGVKAKATTEPEQ